MSCSPMSYSGALAHGASRWGELSPCGDSAYLRPTHAPRLDIQACYEGAQARGTVQACAVDPGSVATAIYRDSKMFSAQPLKWLIENLYAPPWDGAAAVVHAASVPSWGSPARPAGQCSTTLGSQLCVS